ncbi:Mitochondrial-processing peptidase subunit beta [Armadillidium nasatum]|uniref:Mitochondrial-processing peptidase subunit beta n=1 Tax=Armadillidium nasatum TaxID=96803 RepID=A0A5N5T4H3_9CRUS|nr:Mitochondrial-processing peptidase subunit beta [Armadillidium nasatum]
MVVSILIPLAGFVKARVSNTRVDNTVFRFHYRWTTSFCYLCCALVAASDFIGAPIECDNASKAITTFCWVTSTYTINTTTKDCKRFSLL